MEAQDAAEERLSALVRGLASSTRDQVTNFAELLVKDIRENEDRLGWTILGMQSIARVRDNEHDAIYGEL